MYAVRLDGDTASIAVTKHAAAPLAVTQHAATPLALAPLIAGIALLPAVVADVDTEFTTVVAGVDTEGKIVDPRGVLALELFFPRAAHPAAAAPLARDADGGGREGVTIRLRYVRGPT